MRCRPTAYSARVITLGKFLCCINLLRYAEACLQKRSLFCSIDFCQLTYGNKDGGQGDYGIQEHVRQHQDPWLQKHRDRKRKNFGCSSGSGLRLVWQWDPQVIPLGSLDVSPYLPPYLYQRYTGVALACMWTRRCLQVGPISPTATERKERHPTRVPKAEMFLARALIWVSPHAVSSSFRPTCDASPWLS